jgi:hypothetical protein
MTVHQKALYLRPWPIRPGLGGHLGKNLNCIKTRPYLANNRIPKHSQEKRPELNVFFKFLALLCFELLGFKIPRSDWTKGRHGEGLEAP